MLSISLQLNTIFLSCFNNPNIIPRHHDDNYHFLYVSNCQLRYVSFRINVSVNDGVVIRSIKLSKGYVRLTEPGRKKIPFAPNDLEIYHGGNPPAITPATISYSGSPITITLDNDPNWTSTFSVQPLVGLDGIPATFSFGISPATNFGPAGGTTTVTLPQMSLAGAPWGGEMHAKINLLSSDKTPIEHNLGSFKLELYFVTDNISKAFQAGIPLEFIKLFIIPTNLWFTIDFFIDQWVEYAVRLCHASIPDKEHPGGIGGQLIEGNIQLFKDIHCYRYDTVHGLPEFYFFFEAMRLTSTAGSGSGISALKISL
jgi:hypothetical protein